VTPKSGRRLIRATVPGTSQLIRQVQPSSHCSIWDQWRFIQFLFRHKRFVAAGQQFQHYAAWAGGDNRAKYLCVWSSVNNTIDASNWAAVQSGAQANFNTVGYQSLSSAQSGLYFGFSGFPQGNNIGVMDAIVQAPAGG
jgi:hypothetical protein